MDSRSVLPERVSWLVLNLPAILLRHLRREDDGFQARHQGTDFLEGALRFPRPARHGEADPSAAIQSQLLSKQDSTVACGDCGLAISARSKAKAKHSFKLMPMR
eukprot:scaffold650_cov407-Prasinococcus_capsulatus_cf.AAC.8